ncbi:hypothetical protein TRAPUB_12282 [Trametes pubescens]|uniref:Uncharacterized protein n=1 Tax=Trametes pubescens TaxID=154538 RepID=A0A1M2VUG0_TRAPU|nr:hypothetical protein TRAPUB_12282 [Trametes pubescens]
MLARFSSSSNACLARRTTPSLQRLSSQVRFNSSEAAAPPSVSDVDAAPKKRAIPIADSLGDITIASPSQQQEAQSRNGTRNGDRRQNGNGNGNGNWNRDPNRPQRPRQNNNNNFNRDGNGNGNQNRNRANAAGRGQNNPDGQHGGQRPPRQNNQSQGAQPGGQPQREQRRPRRPRDEDEEDRQPFNIPAPRKIEFGNLDELFGTSAARPRAPGSVTPADGAKQLSPSQDRVQTFLERTAGDYSRYVPKTLLSTDVRELTPLELGGFVLSKRRDVKLQARENALAVVGKFPGTNVVVKGAEAPAPLS